MEINESLYASPAYKRSRRAYALECAFEYFVRLLVTEAFLAKLLGSMGISDAMIGIISSFISLAFLFQLFSIFIVQRISNTKRFVVIFHELSHLFFMLLYLIPFMPFAEGFRMPLAVICILAAYFGNYFVTSMIFNWGNSHVHPRHRAEYSSVKEMISLAGGSIMTLVLGFIMDSFEAVDNLAGGFLFAAIAICIFAVCDLVCLLLIKNDIRPKTKRERVPMREVMGATFGNRNFVKIVILTALWNTAQYMTVGFLGTYRVNPHELNFSVTAVQIITLVGSMAHFFSAKPIGRYSDKTSYAKGVKLGVLAAAIGFLCCMLTTPSTKYLIVAYTFFYGVASAATGQNLLNITYSYVDSKYYVQATAIKNSIGGLCGFVASLLASMLLSHVQESGNMLFGIPVYGQQVLAAISLILCVVTVLFIRVFLQKQKTLVQ